MIFSFVLSTAHTSRARPGLTPITSADAQWRHALLQESAEKCKRLTTLPADCKKGPNSTWRKLNKDIKEVDNTLVSLKGPIPLDMAVIRTCSQLYTEVNTYILQTVRINFCVLAYSNFDHREVDLLKEARRIYIEFWSAAGYREQLDTDLRWPVSWSAQLTYVMQTRNDLLEYEWRGIDDSTIEDIFNWAVEAGVGSLDADDRYPDMMDVLKKLPKVTAEKRLKVAWEAEEKLPAQHMLLNEYWDSIKSLNARLDVKAAQ